MLFLPLFSGKREVIILEYSSLTMNDKIEKNKILLFGILTFFIASLIFVAAAEVLLRFTGHDPWKTYQIDKKEPHMHDPDPILGWKNRAGSYVVPPYSPEGKETTVTFLDDGRRFTGVNGKNSREKVVFIGGSLTQGWAVSDEETFAWKLQSRYGQVEIMNYAGSGYGTFQSLLKLESVLQGLAKPPRLVIYGYIDHHEDRNIAPLYWLEMLARYSKRGQVGVPYCTLNNKGQLVRHGPESYSEWPFKKYSALITFLENRYMHWKLGDRKNGEKVTEKLLLEMNELCLKSGTRLLVVMLDFIPERKYHYIRFMNDKRINLANCVFPIREPYQVKGEGHPNGKLHSIWANCISQALDNYLK